MFIAEVKLLKFFLRWELVNEIQKCQHFDFHQGFQGYSNIGKEKNQIFQFLRSKNKYGYFFHSSRLFFIEFNQMEYLCNEPEKTFE